MRQEAFVNPDLLVWARESINMNVAEAAAKIGVKADRLRDWETGESHPTINQARKMSQVYRRPLATFYLPCRPTFLGFSVPHDFRRLPADQPAMLSPQLIGELRRIEYLRDAAIEFAEEIPEEPKGFVGETKLSEPIKLVAQRATSLLEAAVSARGTWANRYDALNAWKEAIERNGVLIMYLNHVKVLEIRGIAIAEPVFPLIAVNGKDHPNGRIFTLVHEFVHLMLGITGLSNLRLAGRVVSYEQRVEQFCNRIAGEVLVPREALLEHDEVAGTTGPQDWTDERIARLARYFGVSREVIVRRLLILGRASEAYYRQKRQQYQKEREAAGQTSGGPMPMSLQIIRAIGQPFARIALAAYHREAISSSELAELLGARIKHLPAVEERLGREGVAGRGDR